MLVKNCILIIAFILHTISATESFFSFELNDLDNHKISFTACKNNKATVIVFLLSDCPASQSYSITLNKLSKKYAAEKIQFFGIFPGKFSTIEEIKSFRQTYKINFPLLTDPDMNFTKFLNASVAPSCFVIDSDGKTVYKGRIDDWLYALGKKRQVVTENNLDDALNAVVKDLPIKKSETKPIGCILEYDN
jgi:peroxiredoxin